MEYITPYKISTITTTGSLNTNVHLQLLFDIIEIQTDENKEGILYAEFGGNNGMQRKGLSKKNKVQKRSPSMDEERKKFDNQVTLEYRMCMENGAFTIVNCKIFNNGNIQMTGVKYIEQGSLLVDNIIQVLNNAESDSICNKITMKNVNYTIQLINCDYKVGFHIKRDALYRIMMNEYNNMCSYEPCIYPGVKIQYMYNKNNRHKNGVCKCESICMHSKGTSLKNGCKKITIAVFQSGSVIITGGQNIDQINETYAWINSVLISHKEHIEKANIILPNLKHEIKKKILLQKSKIINLKNK